MHTAIHNLFIKLCLFSGKQSRDTSDHLFSVNVKLKSDSAWNHTVNMKFSVFLFSVYKRFICFCQVFYVF